MKKAIFAALTLCVANASANAQEHPLSRSWKTFIDDDGDPYEVGQVNYMEGELDRMVFVMRQIKKDVPEPYKSYGNSYTIINASVYCKDREIVLHSAYWIDKNSIQHEYRERNLTLSLDGPNGKYFKNLFYYLCK